MTTREAAHQYLDRGWSVIPVDGKIPLISWKDFQVRLANHETVDLWWDKFPEANVGIVTGKISGITVVDIDGDRGQASLKSSKIVLPPTRIVKTPRGWHMYYRYESSYPQGAGILPGIDIRNDGGFVVAPPSTIEGTEYHVLVDAELAPISPYSALFPPRIPASAPMGIRDPQWVEKLLQTGSQEGTRNQEATRLAGHYRTKNLGASETFEITKIFAERCTPPMDLNELWETVQHIYRYAGDIHRAKVTEEPECEELGDTLIYRWPQYGLSVTLENLSYDKEGLRCGLEIVLDYPGTPLFRFGPENTNLAASRTKESAIKQLQKRFAFDWETVFDTISRRAIYQQREGEPFLYLSNTGDIEPQPLWLLEPFVAESGLSLLFARGDSGKSLLSLAILLSIQTGSPILGRVPVRKTNGLYLDWESSAASLTKRLKMLTEGHAIPETKVAYRNCSIGFSAMLRSIRTQISKDGLGFIVIDAVSGAVGDDIMRQDVTATFANAVRSLHVPTLLISHTKKGTDQDHVGEAYGSAYWFNESRTVMEMRTEQEEGEPSIACHLYHRKNNDGEKTTRFGYRADFSSDSIRFSPMSREEFVVTSSDAALTVADKIMLVLRDGPLTTTEIAEKTGCQRVSISKTIDRHRNVFDAILDSAGKTGREKLWALKNKGRIRDNVFTTPTPESSSTTPTQGVPDEPVILDL